MRVNALVVDLALLGPGAWEFLERVAGALPGLGIVVCTPRRASPARARPADGRGRLGHQALPPRGGPRARGGGRAPPQASLGARGGAGRWWRRSSRSEPTSSRRSSTLERRPHPPRVRGAAAARPGRGQGAPARGDLPGGVGLRDGPRRPLRGRVHPQGPTEAGEGLAELELHPHALRGGYRFDPSAASGPRRLDARCTRGWGRSTRSLGAASAARAEGALLRFGQVDPDRGVPRPPLTSSPILRHTMSTNQRIGLVVAAVVVAVVELR